MSYHTSASGLLLPNSVRAKLLPSDDFRQIEVFARNGFVVFRRPTPDGSEVAENVVNVTSAKRRHVAMSEHLARVKELSREYSALRDKIAPLSDFVERLEQCIRQAEEQGPFEYEDMRRARVRSAKTTVSIPAGIQCSSAAKSE